MRFCGTPVVDEDGAAWAFGRTPGWGLVSIWGRMGRDVRAGDGERLDTGDLGEGVERECEQEC
jgi:hypothetical protein